VFLALAQGYRVEDPGAVMLGTKVFCFIFFFNCFDIDLSPLLTTGGSCFTTRSIFTADLARHGEGYFEPFQKDYYVVRAVRVRPAFDLQERFQVRVHQLKQEGSSPRDSMTNLVEKYLFQSK
jgi:hypothetical protein